MLLMYMLSVDGASDAGVEARIRIDGINSECYLLPLLTSKDISLIVRGRLFSSCLRSSALRGSETWPVWKEAEVALASRGESGQMDVWH